MDVRNFWCCTLLSAGILLLSLSACDDSSDVGLGVGPDSLKGGAPTTLDVVPALDTTRVPPQTGRVISSTIPGQVGPQSWRFLAGRVDDPVGGTIEANGYFDVLGRTFIPDQILTADDADSLSAQLRLTTTYVHGDTSSPVEVRVLDLEEEADMNRARADASFPTNPAELARASISPTDSLVTISLPQSWISDNLEVLQDTSDGPGFQNSFHGFKLSSTGGNAVVGFSTGSASLRLLHIGDSTTVDYRGFKSFTHVDRRNVPSPPQNRILLQDGVGIGLRMRWNFDENPLDSLKNSPLNRAEILVPVDTATLKANAGGASFVRPLPNGFRVLATRASGPDVPPCPAVGAASPPQSDSICVLPLTPTAAPEAAFVPSNVAFPIFEMSLLESPVFTQFRVEIADRSSTNINSNATVQPGLPSTLPVLVPTSGTGDPGRPRATLTVTLL